MIILPPSLRAFQKEAEEALASKAVKDVEFSGGTYQVLVNDEWAFLQLDPEGRLKDSFCSCKASGKGCLHQAAALLYIYADFPEPLHKRVVKSFWGVLSRLCSDAMGTLPDQLKAAKDGRYICRGPKNRELFSIQCKTKESTAHLQKLLFNRREETEETSLKFSNLSQDELLLWQQGKPTPELAYELSCWSDIAKWLKSLQEANGPYDILIGYSTKKIPNSITANFPDLTVKWTLPEDWLPRIIPSLGTVASPLYVKSESSEGIEKITYDKERKRFHIVQKKERKSKKAEWPKGIDFGDWTYIPFEGFISKKHSFLDSQADLDDIEGSLTRHAAQIKELISGAIVREVPVTVSYALSFDKEWNLHIQSYLFNPGDLIARGTETFGSWVYIEDKGFYRWEGRYFDEIETVVRATDVPDFISQHRAWFNTQEGFHMHLNVLNSDLVYHLNDDDYLTFSRNLAYQDDGISKDFGRYIYIANQGFFSKSNVPTSLPLRAGVSVPPDQISHFIDMHKDDLQLVQNFFSARSPLEKAKLDIEALSDGKICITPKYQFLPDYKNQKVSIFDDYSYVAGDGFFCLKGILGLPEKYRHQVILEGEAVISFLKEELPSIKPFIGKLDPKVKQPLKTSLVAENIELVVAKGEHHYEVKLDYQTELGTISLASLWTALQKNQHYLFSPEGCFDLTDKRYGWLKSLKRGKIDRRKNVITLSSLEFLRLNAVDEISILPGKGKSVRSSRELLNGLLEFRTPENPDIKGLKSTLRPYQQLGVHWLWFLYHYGLSGLLCDDMGLGKTHQAMALMAAIYNHAKAQDSLTKRYFLVVCPTSVIYHWQEKLKHFLPGLKVWTFYGTNRTLEGFETHDILLTSYGIFRNESSTISEHSFEAAIFDELQIAKNQTSRIYSALLKTTARMKLGMTGTPIENRLRELKSLFDIVLPQYMPSENEYREQFIRPIEKEGSETKRQALARLVKPFVLRRKKEDVLLDLPEKTEEIAHCELLPEQHKLYVDVLVSQREKLLDELLDDTLPIPYMHIFTLLSRLKQICNHPAAYFKVHADYKKYQSGKWDLFIELLQEARESGQKVVVFTHYLSMMDIIEDYLNEHGIGFASIRGATLNRGQQLERFNKDPECEVFVGSLQAAGLGIDLTAGSVVIHYDRWWNAARENQATDRVHRIGQTRGVQVFKLMTKGTLEEHIDFLISKKRRLLEDVVSVDDHQTIKKFDRKEIIELLQAVPMHPLQ